MRHRNGASCMPKNRSPPTSNHFPVKLSHYKSRRELIHSLGQSFCDLFAFWNLVTGTPEASQFNQVDNQNYLSLSAGRCLHYVANSPLP